MNTQNQITERSAETLVSVQTVGRILGLGSNCDLPKPIETAARDALFAHLPTLLFDSLKRVQASSRQTKGKTQPVPLETIPQSGRAFLSRRELVSHCEKGGFTPTPEFLPFAVVSILQLIGSKAFLRRVANSLKPAFTKLDCKDSVEAAIKSTVGMGEQKNVK